MYAQNELNTNLEEYNDYEEFPYCLEWDIESAIRFLYLNTDIVSRKDAEEILNNCEDTLVTLIDDSPHSEFWINCIRIEILAYRLFEIDRCNENICQHILQCKILGLFSNGKEVEREIFEQMMLLLSEIIPDIDGVVYYGEYNQYIQDSLKMIEYKKLIRNGNFKEAYLIYKSLMSNLVINEDKYLKDYDFSKQKEVNISSIEKHNSWIKNKFETFLLVANSANSLEDAKDHLEKIFREHKVKSLTNDDIEEMKIRIEVEKFCSGDISGYDTSDINEFMRYFEKLNLLDKTSNNSHNSNMLFLYIQVLMKVTTETYYNQEFDYKSLHEKLIKLCNKIKWNMDQQKYHIVGHEYKKSTYYDMEILSGLLLCLYKPDLLDEVMKEVKSYTGNNDIINKIFKILSVVYLDKDSKESEDKEAIKEIIIKVIQLYRDITYIEQLLKVVIYDKKEFAYYTTLQTFSYLLFDEENNKTLENVNKYRLSIMNSGYMNDPNEGCVFYDILRSHEEKSSNIYDILIGNLDKKVRRQYNNSLVFLKSFSSKIDKLTMWSEYGDKGKGCCIVVDGETFRACNIKLILLNEQYNTFKKIDDEYNLYNVIYWNSLENNFIVNGEENIEVKRVLEKILSNIVTISDKYNAIKNINLEESHVVNIIKDLLSRLCYLIKYDEYQDENEVRLIIKRDCHGEKKDDIVKIEDGKEKLRSMLYIHYPLKTIIKEVILGPKVVDSDSYAPFILMKLSDINNKCDYYTELTNSSIDYR